MIDALNVAYWCGGPPSLRLPLVVACGLLERAESVRLVFDASTQYQIPPQEHAVYQAVLQRPALATQVRTGESADRMLLAIAKATEGCIVSRDRFREHRRRYRSIVGHANRCLDGWVARDRVVLPSIGLDVALPDSAEAAWIELQRLAPRREISA